MLMKLPLFANQQPASSREDLQEGAVLLRGFAVPDERALLNDVSKVAGVSPFRYLVTRGGKTMSVAMTNCGRVGWLSDRKGYRYDPIDPETGASWPAMPESFLNLAVRAAAEAGFESYDPDACLVNKYAPGARLGLHQDRDENDQWAPIVSVSLGVPATFLWGGLDRSDTLRRFPLYSGDVVVWGGPARFVYHGIAPLKPAVHDLTGELRINLTFRKVY